jgi:hypothetical protein
MARTLNRQKDTHIAIPSDPIRDASTLTANAARWSPGVSGIESKAVVCQFQEFSSDTDSPNTVSDPERKPGNDTRASIF